MRALLCLAMAAALAGCAPEPEQVGKAALDRALEGTRDGTEAPGTAFESPPLAGASPHRLKVSSQFTLVEGSRVYRRIGATRVIDRGRDGAFRVVDHRRWSEPGMIQNGYDDGREGLYDGSRFAVRRRWGPWMERETVGGHAQRFLTQAYDVAPAVLGAFGPYIRWSRDGDGPTTIAGVGVTWERASLDPAVVPEPMGEEALVALRDHESRWTAWLRATHRPDHIEGKVAWLSDGRREMVAGHLEVRGSATVEGKTMPFDLVIRYEVEDLPERALFLLPDSLAPATRPRPWKEIVDLLGDDLAPIYRR